MDYSSGYGKNGSKEPLYQRDEFDDNDSNESEEIYIVRQKYGYISIFLSLIQVAVLILMIWQCKLAPFTMNPMIGPYPDALSYWGGKNTVLIVEDGEYWRLVTPIFLHAGVIHLLGNISVQMDIGAFFEREWGSFRYLIIYIASAVGSSLLSCIVMPNSISVGSSGALMGLFGAKLSEVFCRSCESKRTKQGRIGHEVRMEQCGGVLCSVLIVGLFSFIPFVDWAAHLGGLLAGIAVGLILFSTMIQSCCWSLIWFIVGVALTGAAFTWEFVYLFQNVEASEELRDVCDYYKQFYDDYECNCQYSLNDYRNGGDN